MNDKDKQPTVERDDVAVLVRLAGKRQAVPPARAERVRAAARTQWQQKVRRRSRSRFLWTAAALTAAASLILVVALVILPFGTGTPLETQPIVVQSVTGEVWFRDAENGSPSSLWALRRGVEVRPGTEIVTSPDGRAALLLASGHSIRLDNSASLRLVDATSVALDRGALYVDSGSDIPGQSVDVVTSFGVVHEIGTQFEVRLDDENLRVRLREGAVEVQGDGDTHHVIAGNELTLNQNGTVTWREMSTHGPEWDWIIAVTPMLDLEGHTARSFLNWIAREKGLTVAFADETVAHAAAEIVLSGTAEGMTIDEALDAVLPTCKMTYRIDKELLLIAAAPEPAPAV